MANYLTLSLKVHILIAVPVIIVDKGFKLTKTVSGKNRQQVDNKWASRQ